MSGPDLDVREHVPLAPLTTLGLGGPARRLLEVRDEAELVAAVREVDASGEPLLILGGGSNVVIADEGFAGTVVLVRTSGIEVDRKGRGMRLHVAAGERLDALVERAVQEGWAGLETLSGIPGTVGATPLQNVGAYGAEISEVTWAVRSYDRQRKQLVRMRAEDLGFGYRTSILRGQSRWIVVEVELELHDSRLGGPMRYAELARALGVGSGGRAPISEIRETVLGLRRQKGMVVDPADPDSISAGSFFTNPVLDVAARTRLEQTVQAAGLLEGGATIPVFAAPGGTKVPAAWLIEKAGFTRGLTRGGVGISRKHALALVNRGGTATELLSLAREIRDTVEARFGVRLEPEPILVGASL